TAAPLEPELDALAHAAQQLLRATVDEHDITETQHAVINAASAAIAAGITLSAIAAAEQIGQDRAKAELGNELLRRVERTARRARETATERDHTIARAARLGLAHRDIASSAQIPHSTIRAIIARANNQHEQPTPADPAAPNHTPDERHDDERRGDD
ncbi:MAG: hypothetical protein ACLP22_01525, partial [Solirubrobacteraceae bacterium]